MFYAVNKVLEESGFSFAFRNDDRVLWDNTLKHLTYIPVDYTNESIDYQLAYQYGHGGEWQDISVIVFWSRKPVALWPLSVSNKIGKFQLSSHGMPVLPPVFVKECSFNARKKITSQCLDLANRIAQGIELLEWCSGEAFHEGNGLSEWHIQSMRCGATCGVRHELFVDLGMDIAVIKARFRDSLKSRIAEAERLWRVEVLCQPGDDRIWQEFKNLHLSAAGCVTRSEETWNLQHKAIGQNQAILITLRDHSNQMVGAGLFDFTRDEGLYSVAAFNRTLFDKPLGHAVQFRAIQELKQRGIRWYKIGVRFFKSEIPVPTRKEISISEFKEAFATHVYPTYQLTHKVGRVT